MLLNIENVLSKSKYVGVSNHKGKLSHIFETELKGQKTWIIIDDKKGRGLGVYSISDSDKILDGIRKPT